MTRILTTASVVIAAAACNGIVIAPHVSNTNVNDQNSYIVEPMLRIKN